MLRYIGAWKKGLAWDGQRWAIDDSGHWERAAVRTAQTMLDEAREEFLALPPLDADSSADEQEEAQGSQAESRVGRANSKRQAAPQHDRPGAESRDARLRA